MPKAYIKLDDKKAAILYDTHVCCIAEATVSQRLHPDDKLQVGDQGQLHLRGARMNPSAGSTAASNPPCAATHRLLLGASHTLCVKVIGKTPPGPEVG